MSDKLMDNNNLDNQETQISVLLVDDHPMVQGGLTAFLDLSAGTHIHLTLPTNRHREI